MRFTVVAIVFLLLGCGLALALGAKRSDQLPGSVASSAVLAEARALQHNCANVTNGGNCTGTNNVPCPTNAGSGDCVNNEPCGTCTGGANQSCQGTGPNACSCTTGGCCTLTTACHNTSSGCACNGTVGGVAGTQTTCSLGAKCGSG